MISQIYLQFIFDDDNFLPDFVAEPSCQLFDFIDGVDQAGVDGLQVTTLLHGDDAQVIFLIAPDQEGLVDVVVDTTASGPVAASVGSLK